MIGVGHHLPADLALIGTVLVMVLGWQWLSLIAGDLAATPHASINPGERTSISRPVLFIKRVVVRLGEIVLMFIKRHFGALQRVEDPGP